MSVVEDHVLFAYLLLKKCYLDVRMDATGRSHTLGGNGGFKVVNSLPSSKATKEGTVDWLTSKRPLKLNSSLQELQTLIERDFALCAMTLLETRYKLARLTL